MTANVASIRSAVKARIDAVADKGQTHDYFRWARDDSALLDQIVTTVSGTDQIRAWMLTVYGPVSNVPAAREFHRKEYEIELHGYLGLDDSAATEKTMANLAEDVVEELEKYPDLNGTLTNGAYTDDGQPSIEEFDHRMFAGRFCHHVLITATVYEKGTITYTV